MPELTLADVRVEITDAALELLKVPPGRERVARWPAFEEAVRRYAILADVELVEADR